MAEVQFMPMPEAALPAHDGPGAAPPSRRGDLIIRPMSADGSCVVKDPVGGAYYNLGPHEAFLLEQLDGSNDQATICASFQLRFGEPLQAEDLDEFIKVARTQRFLVTETTATDAAPAKPSVPSLLPKLGHSLLFIRRSILDPDRILNWLEPKVRFLWTRAFVLVSLTLFLFALAALISNWNDLITYFPRSYEMVILAWFVIGLATAIHEFAHGLTCKHFGGEVHDMGFLLMFFLPCFYCDVSDAWLMRERSKRLWITLAGTYSDMCVWTLAVFCWRLFLPGTVAHNLALIIITVCGVRMLFNFNPLLKLDGYYMLGDWLEIPNLRQRAIGSFMGHVRWLLWGAARPAAEPKGVFLLCFGVVVWVFSLVFLSLMLLALFHYLGTSWGVLGFGVVAFLAYHTLPAMLKGLTGGEVMNMLKLRPVRSGLWLALLAGIGLFLAFFPMQDRASGNFKVRPTARAEVRAPVSGFLREVFGEEGSAVSAGAPIVALHIPDLASKLAQKQAELTEAQAKLRLLQAGPRAEELREQRAKVERAKSWRELATQDLERKTKAHAEELVRLTELIKQHQVDMDAAQETLVQARRLVESRALSSEQLRETERRYNVAHTQHQQALAQKRERQAIGLQDAEAELARRGKDLADAQAVLDLLILGHRPEEIDAQKALLARVQEEANYLDSLQKRVNVTAPLAGVISTPHVREKIGQYFKEGDLICEIEDPSGQEVEVTLPEQEVSRVKPGCNVNLKARALPYETIIGQVQRIAPTAVKEKNDAQGHVTVYCRIVESESVLSPGMTGYARIECGQRAVGALWLGRLTRYVRTEFWW